MAQKKLDYDNPLLKDYAESEPEGKRPQGRPKKAGIIRNYEGGNSSQEGLTGEYTRFSVISKVKNVNDIKDYAFTKRLTIRETFDEIIEDFFKRYRKNPKNEELLDHTRKGTK